MKLPIIILVALLFILVCPINTPSCDNIRSGSYFSDKQDIIETEKEILYTREIIQIMVDTGRCFYIRERMVETKDVIPLRQRDINGEFLKYSGKFIFDKNELILKLTLVESKNSTDAKNAQLVLKIAPEYDKLIQLDNNKIFRYVKK